ncbi:MAG: S-layer homology domain-containing protein [Oscillospiraceae bacterium]|nr:S-layer homology domain-containing protein [Oscillospiraceae bacterium]
MKTRQRLLSLILVLCLLAGSVSAASNTSPRHTPAAGLSDDALRYYTGVFSFASLAALPGSASQPERAMDSELFDALHDLMSATMTQSYSYSSLPTYWRDTDASGSGGAVYFYSDMTRPADSILTREHVWAKSHGTFYESGAGSDLHHLRPEDYNINTDRSNFTFGNVRRELTDYRSSSLAGREVLWYDANYYGNGCKGLVEVADNVKGDVARILLYVYVTYEQPNLTANTGAVGEGNERSDGRKVIESLDTLLDWCRSDPVDQWELRRNDLVQALQGNRNVFIDYPEFAWLLFDRAVPDMQTPSGYAHAGLGTGFSDVSPDAWYASGVSFAVSRNLMNGVGNGRFAPDSPLTRAQIVTILYRLAGSPDPGAASSYFRDIPDGQWYTDAVIWAAGRNIVNGYRDGRFHPDRDISRQELVTILYRYSEAKPGKIWALLSFPDRDQVSDYAVDAMRWAVGEGLINGVKTEKGVLLSPGSGTTRAQFAVILQRWLS